MNTAKATRLLPTLVCAWCKDVMKPGSPKVSHGICRPCAARFFGKIGRRVARIPRRATA